MEMKSLLKPMAFAFLLVAALLAVAPFTAKAQIASTDAARYLAILPLVEYDHKYYGTLNMNQISDELMAKLCPKTNFRTTLGCAYVGKDDRVIMIASDETIKRAGWDRATVVRDEIGHCNGWPNDHSGARWEASR
jgi:hypothetical protein